MASSTEALTFNGVTGYANFVGTLQTVAAQYAKSGYTTATRMMGYDGQTLTISDTSSFDGTSNTPPSTTSTGSPTIGTGHEYGNGILGDTLYLKDYLLVSSIYKKDNNIDNYCETGTCAYSVGSTNVSSYWLASRYYYYYSSTTFRFAGRTVSGGRPSFKILRDYGRNWYNSETNYLTFRPIITLKSDVTISGGSGAKDNPYTLN